ncbi:putative alpha crystallin/Hsp20 domain, HSP20-like chaperone [Helianthus annuus]|nr:putative alpha crystallin/Hsp20 domain, HSP20-like chaperone [Helianthus annuus]
MESKGAPTPTRIYQDFEPSMEWVPEDDSDTLLIYLPGFAKEQLRVQLRARNLIISGERKLHQNTWSRFSVQFPVSGNCDLNKISAKFEGNILFVRQPKLITPAAKPEEVKPITPAAKLEEAKPAAPPKPVDEPNVDQNTTTEVKPTPTPTIQSNIEKKEVVKDKDHPKTGVEEKGEKSEGKAREEGVYENESKKKTSEWEAEKNVLETYKRTAGALARKLKTSANGVNTIAIVVVGLVIGIYVSNSIKSWTNA